MVRICPVGYGRGCHFGILRTGEEEELLDLMRGDISEDAAITLALEEPTGSGSLVDAVRAQPDGINNRADCASPHQLPGSHDAAHSEVLGMVDRIDALRFRLHTARFIELSQRGHAGLVRHEILAGAHNLDGQGCSVSIYASARHQSDIRIVYDTSATIEADRLRIALGEVGGEIVLRREKACEGRTRAKQRIR